MNKSIYVVGLLTSVITFFTACANDQQEEKRKRLFGSGGSGEQFTTVDVEAASTEEDSLFALAADSVEKMTLKVSCDGTAEKVVEDSQFDLPVGAKNCKAKLVALKIGAKTYVEPAGGSGMSHYLKNDVGKLVNQANAKEVLHIKVKQQLGSPLTANSSVQYVYTAVSQFDTVEAENAPIDPAATPTGIAAPEVKVSKAFIGPAGGLNAHVECTAANGFQGTVLENLKCGTADLKSIKFAVAVQDDAAFAKLKEDKKTARIAEVASKGLLVQQFAANKMSAVYSEASKVVLLNFGVPKEKKTHILVASRTDAGVSSYAYGFIRLGGTKVLDIADCPAQGNQANFVQDGVSLDGLNIGMWRDTSNCWVWQRVLTEKVKSKERFKQCAPIQAGTKIYHRTLPYYSELKAARDRNLHVIAKGAAPGIGANVDQETFWLAGGRVFNMADGSVREVKDIQKDEVHTTICVSKRNK